MDQPLRLGYYTLAATSISLTDLPASLSKKLPRYPAIPATLMGRLAVDARHRGQRLGELLLLDAFSRTLRAEIATYAFVIDAKDEAAAGFYRAYNFQPLTAEGRRMLVPMAEIAKLFTSLEKTQSIRIMILSYCVFVAQRCTFDLAGKSGSAILGSHKRILT